MWCDSTDGIFLLLRICFRVSFYMSKGDPIKENKEQLIPYWRKMKGILNSPTHCEEETTSPEGQQTSSVTTN